MASYLDKTKVPTAVTDNTKLDLGHQSIGTTDFFHLEVSTIHELVPGSKIDVKQESFARLNPMPVPTFARASMTSRAFFVPFRTIFRGAYDFLSDAPHIASDGNFDLESLELGNVPYITNLDLCNTFIQRCLEEDGDETDSEWMDMMTDDTAFAIQLVADSLHAADFPYAGNLYCFTVKGRRAIQQIEELGYKVNWDTKDEHVYSALPILALAKVYSSYYYPAQYLDTYGYCMMEALCNKDITGTPAHLDYIDLQALFSYTAYTQYDSDAFTSAWDVPNSPNEFAHGDYRIVNVDSVSEILGNGASPTATFNIEQGYVSNNSGSSVATNRIGGADAPFISPVVTATRNSSTFAVTPPVSEYLLHSLSALSAFLKRNQLAGSRSWERMLARYGKAISSEKMNRPLYLGSFSQDIQIGDVMSTADTVNAEGTSGSQLGGYSGKGISYGNGHFDFSADEFGYFIILTSVVPHVLYTQGVDPQVKRVTRTQFFLPEFDALGAAPVEADTLFIPQEGAASMTGNPHEQVFGWAPRYWDYKQSTTCDRIVGNFRLPSINGGAQDGNTGFNASSAWHMQRTFNGESLEGDWSNLVHSLAFVDAGNDVAQYKRLFYYTAPDAPDNMTYIHNFEIAEYFPGKSLYDTWDFDKEGKMVTLEVNGVKMN